MSGLGGGKGAASRERREGSRGGGPGYELGHSAGFEGTGAQASRRGVW
jgi:hypothetical protein